MNLSEVWVSHQIRIDFLYVQQYFNILLLTLFHLCKSECQSRCAAATLHLEQPEAPLQ